MTERKDVVVRKGEVQKARPRGLVPFEDIDRWMDRMFDEVWGRGWMRPMRWERALTELAAPHVDIVDRDEDVLVRAEVPGVKKEDLEVTISGNLLTIKGEAKREEKEEKGDYYRAETVHGEFSRTLTLPATVDESKAKAALKDGVLELTLPKTEQAKRRTIKID